ncbi:SOS response-associated peptidase family protein [Rhodanobacter sp. B2A1Ga4]|uniref:SOS response-associated peptidase family protein n=1 Tax=Rhodanobacter sp. B2A1Ga4 TaxID=2778647 RepID=UPI001B3796E1|nr:SOS response-associated peptidase family protein [Rhodanobacter sp. B2A1Ga4]MBQ4855775.1 SOS response-associated peptidase family protein [Rhodanobacter sp. B2A1Ga4]
MCFSACEWADYRHFVRTFGAIMSIGEYVRLFSDRARGAKIKIPKAMTDAFANPKSDQERQAKAFIAEFDVAQAGLLEQELFKQKKRLADAERVLVGPKPTKKATEDRRIANQKIPDIQGKLADLHRTEPQARDSRIFPDSYASVMLVREGKRVVMPMRYHCRPEGMPASIDRTKDGRVSGTYNARRDNLERFWRNQFGHTHAVMVVNRFYENVARHTMEHRDLAPGEREENVVLEFNPEPAQDMIIACLYSHWTSATEDLWSFAAITDEPPPEVAAAGHDRCIIQIKPEHVDAWLNPDSANTSALQAILDDRPLAFYEHRLAA